MPGLRGKNLRSGDLAEQLGLLLLRSVALVAPVPRTEDVGIDVVATLLRSFDSQMLLAEDSFFVQIKSASVSSIEFKGEEVRWLYHLELPFFIASADRRNGSVKLYCAHRLSDAFITNHDRDSLIIQLDDKDTEDEFVPKDEPNVHIGPPAIEWSLDTANNEEFREKFYEIVKEHIKISKESLRAKELGYAILVKWKTNELPVTVGSKFQSPRSEENLRRAEDAMAPYLTVWLFELMSSRNWGMTPESLLSLLKKLKKQIIDQNLSEGRPARGTKEIWPIVENKDDNEQPSS